MSHRKWRETKRHPNIATSGHQISCSLISLNILWDILSSHSVVCTEMRFILCTWFGEISFCSFLAVLPGSCLTRSAKIKISSLYLYALGTEKRYEILFMLWTSYMDAQLLPQIAGRRLSSPGFRNDFFTLCNYPHRKEDRREIIWGREMKAMPEDRDCNLPLRSAAHGCQMVIVRF